jgi:hypothetical protein
MKTRFVPSLAGRHDRALFFEPTAESGQRQAQKKRGRPESVSPLKNSEGEKTFNPV